MPAQAPKRFHEQDSKSKTVRPLQGRRTRPNESTLTKPWLANLSQVSCLASNNNFRAKLFQPVNDVPTARHSNVLCSESIWLLKIKFPPTPIAKYAIVLNRPSHVEALALPLEKVQYRPTPFA